MLPGWPASVRRAKIGGMPNALNDPPVAAALARMFAATQAQEAAGQLTASRRDATMTAAERADAAASLYMPVSPEGGRLLYALVRAIRPATVVEFGTSFGVSTLYLAAAVRDNGAGHVTTTELSASKARAAQRTFTEAGLDDVITVLEGDALATLAGLAGPVGLVLLDGWKDLCLPVLQLLEPQLAPGALVVADDSSFPSMKPYLDYVRAPGSGYESVSFPVGDHMEVSCRT